MSTGYSRLFSRLSPLDWCAYLEAEGPRGLLGAPAIAGLCGAAEPPGPRVEMAWHGARLGGPGGLRTFLAGPPRLEVKPPANPRPKGSGGYVVNPLLTRRLAPVVGGDPFPGCIQSPRGPLGTPLLEPLEAREPGPCPHRAWRPLGEPLVIGGVVEGLGDCVEALTPWGSRLALCGGIAYSGGHMVSLDGSRLAVRTGCLDYLASILHPGGPIEAYLGEGALETLAVSLECPGARIYASSPWSVRVEVEPGQVIVESPAGMPYALGVGGILDAARALFELATPPDSRADRGGVGHARCSNCVGSSLVEGDRLVLYAWTPTRHAGVLEVRLHVPAGDRAVILDAAGESWVPVERGLFRVPLPPGWHSLVLVEIGVERVWERLRRLRGSSRPRTP